MTNGYHDPEATDIAVAAIEEVERPRADTLRLSNGVVLRIKSVPPLLLRAVATKIPEPEVPIWHNEEKDRDEPNPADPDYIAALAKRDELQSMAIADMALMKGTEIFEVPAGFPTPESDDWVAEIGENVELNLKTPGHRYLAWLRFVALETNTDIAMAVALPLEIVGLSEKEVDVAINSFRSLQGWGADSAGQTNNDNSNGDKLRIAGSRNGAGNRRARSRKV